jgi:hypothetical protein
MSKRSNKSISGSMLDLWRPPQDAGDPIGCLATTYTFSPGLFDEQCLGRFLEIDSEPSREDLAFRLERESLLGSVYVGVLVDHTQAGVEHSLRWDVLPVRIRNGKQHAKLSMLVWSRHIRIIVSSANLTEPGYRTNQEVTATVNLTPLESDNGAMDAAIDFLRGLISLVPGAAENIPEVKRARSFLDQVERQIRDWHPNRKQGATVLQKLLFTLPAIGQDQAERSSLDEAVLACRKCGSSPNKVWIASPFFDIEEDAKRLTITLCKNMARGERRELTFCVPAIHDDGTNITPQLAAPEALFTTPQDYNSKVFINMLPKHDEDKNPRIWHAKMMAFLSDDDYSALMVGSSNFTCAGMGLGQYHNAEANLITIVKRRDYGRESGQLCEIWPNMEPVIEPESAEWAGTSPDKEEEDQAKSPPLPGSFISATYRAGDKPRIILRLDSDHLPEEWCIHACSLEEPELLSSSTWRDNNSLSVVELDWLYSYTPNRLLVRWDDHEAFFPINVEDSRNLPPLTELANMSVDDILWISAAPDRSAAFRAWARTQQSSEHLDEDFTSTIPIELDPLRRYDLQATFLHRVRHRARILAQLQSNLERPAWGLQALEWRLRGMVGVEPLADRLVRDFVCANNAANEALLTLADLLIVLREVNYKPSDGSLSKEEFEQVFRLFLRELTEKIDGQVQSYRSLVSDDIMQFFKRVIERCQI